MRFLAETYYPPLFVDNPWYVIPSTLLVYPPYFFLFARNVRSRGLANNSDPEMILIALATVFAVIGLDVAIKAATSAGISAKTVIIMRVAHGFVCTFILYCEFKVLYGYQLKTEQEVTRRLLAERERQYQISRENIEAINIKCHDIRHQIRQLANTRGSIDPDTLEDISQEVNVYELTADTGNEALDTILTEKGLACYREGIGLTFMADGSAIDFMAPSDIYSFFGNALDNAIEAVRQVTSPECRIIDVRVERRHEMASILIENCYDTSPVFVNGIPRTSKGDEVNHGFGIRSMQLVAAHYDGTVQVSASDGIFSFSAILMRPEQSQRSNKM